MAHIHFVGRSLSENWPDLAELDETSINLQAERFRGGVNNWVIQTYLHLKDPLEQAGIRATIGESPEQLAINISHRDCLRQFSGRTRYFYTVGIRADRPPIQVCDWEVLQNNLHPVHGRQRHLPFWPQPGLVVRKPERANRIERMAYFGRTGTLSEWIKSPLLQRELQSLGVHFEIREDRWFDYSDVDLVLAHRHEAPTMLEQKPPSKLINAWHAGVPAILGFEPAFEQLRKSDLDYLRADSADELIASIRKLKQDFNLYKAMIENGQRRSQHFSLGAIRQRWLDFLLFEVYPDAEKTFEEGLLNRHGWAKSAVQSMTQKLQSRWFKTRCAWELHCIRQGYNLSAMHQSFSR